MIWNLEEHIVKKIKKPFIYFCVLFTGFIFLISFTPIVNWMAKGLVVTPLVKKSDVIAVLGGGVYKNGVLTSATSERFIHGIILFKKGYGEKLFFTGATIKELDKKIMSAADLSDDSDVNSAESTMSGASRYNEGQTMFATVYNMGIPPESIAYDDRATHTYANMVELKKYMDFNKLSTCMIVTSPTHMYRAMGASEKAGLDCTPAPVDDYTGEITSSTGRLSLFYTILWEYAGLVFYKLYGYI